MINRAFFRTLLALIFLFSFFLVIGNIYIYKQQKSTLFNAFTQLKQVEVTLLSQLAKESLITENYALIEWFFSRWGQERNTVVSLSLKNKSGFSIVEYKRLTIPQAEVVSTHITINLHNDSYQLSLSSETLVIAKLLHNLQQQLIWISSIAIILLGITIWYLFKFLAIRPLLHEIKLRQNAEQHYHHLAHHDPLTSLPNRLLFSDRLEQAKLKSKRVDEPFALLYIDLDQFKQINDSMGHTIGDAVLVQVAENLKKCVRADDTIARVGGDEFMVILASFHNIDVIINVANKIIHAVQQEMIIQEKSYHITSSIGISIYPDDTHSTEKLIRNADSAMFKVKEKGRNTFQFYTEELTLQALRRVDIENGIRRALVEKEFIVWYQPQYDIVTATLVGMEALVRWDDPVRGIIPPNEFIPLAEESGLIIELGREVIDQVMKQVVIWKNKGFKFGRVAINLSGKQLISGNISSEIKELLEKNQCQVEWIDFEITESFIMSDSKKAIKCLHDLSDMGFKIAVDDFGTGYSSLAYLKHLPISKLKIDRSFIKDLPIDKDDIGISRAIIALAKGLDLDVIAEGVETTEQADFLHREGCTLAQGYLYSKPLPVDEVTKIIQN